MYASYELRVLTKNGKAANVMPHIKEEILVRLTELSGYQLAGYPHDKWEILKWPDYIHDMKHISFIYVDFIFLLNREGERPGDLRKDYFYGGVHFSDVARIKFNDLTTCINEVVNEYEKQMNIRDGLFADQEYENEREMIDKDAA